ncbi:MlaD family protein [Mycolicibacterium sp. XJ2]
MLTRAVRTQLIVFTIASVIAVTAMVFGYLRVPTWFGIGHITVTAELPGTGGLYRFGNVTYRGVQIGKVTSVSPTATGATATLSLRSSPKIPADVQANVRSVSAVGEQYVDLVPRADGPPYLRDGAVIAEPDTTIPLRVGPVLDELSALVKSVPKRELSDLLDESYLAFDGAGYDLGSLMDSGSRIAAESNATAERTRALIDDSEPLIASQAQSADALRIWARSLAAVTGQMVDNDANFRTLLGTGPGAADEIARLLEQVKPTLPVLLANLTTVGEVGVTYNPALRQLLVLLPPYVAGFGSLSQLNNPLGLSYGGFSLMNGDPPACTVGFLPPSEWRSPEDETVIDTPDNLYCKLPQDSPIAVRGVRNNPCMSNPGKRAPTVEICNSDRPFEPTAMRQHVLGPYPFDPNLIAQGVTPDSRVDADERIFGPVEGTPLPPPAAPVPAVPVPAAPGPAPAPVTPNALPDSAPHGVAAATAKYDPRTGRYVGADGQVYQQTDLSSGGEPSSWQDLLPR